MSRSISPCCGSVTFPSKKHGKFNINLLFFITITLLIVNGCSKDPAGPDEGSIPEKTLAGAFITNEGNFMSNEASLSFYDIEADTMYNNVFYNANNQQLGDIAQSITLFDTLAFIVVNNSHKIEVISIHNYKRVATIHTQSPRYLQVLDRSKAYVTNLYKNYCSVIDLNSWQVVDSINVGANPEEIIIANDKLYVANSGWGFSNTISVISTGNDEVIQTIEVGTYPNFLSANESKDKIYAVCKGYSDWYDQNNDLPGSIWIIDTNSDTILDSLHLEEHASGLTLGSDDKGYYIGEQGISEFSLQALLITNHNLISGSFRGLHFEQVSKCIYTLTNEPYPNTCELVIYDQNGTEMIRHEAGIFAGFIAFYYHQEVL